MKILFMCVANSARSQLAHGLAKSIFLNSAEIDSAGSKPTSVNPFAIKALMEIGIDIKNHTSKTTDQISPDFINNLDYVITLCAEEVCPILISKAKKLHWPLPDPAGRHELSQDEQLEFFRKTRDDIKEKLLKFKKEI
jgi:arsenate reductase